MALTKKRELLYRLRPDVAVIPECSRSSLTVCNQEGFEGCWWGVNDNKGLGVLVRKPWRLAPVGRSLQLSITPKQKWVAAVRVQGPQPFLLIAVWATQVGNVREMNYVGQLYEAISRHPRWFQNDLPTVICGDFNSNASFDPGRRKRTHSAMVRMLSDRGLVSAYHAFFSEQHGNETRPTYYFWHREDRCFHLDYIFVPRTWANRIHSFEVGSYLHWRRASDHVPLVAEIGFGTATPHQSPGEVTNSRTLLNTEAGASASISTVPS